MIQLYCGEGKGKTTAAVGAAIRAAGNGRHILFARFMKGRESGEIAILEELPNIRVLKSREDFPFYAQMSAAQREALRSIHEQIGRQIVEALEAGEEDFVVLDEITHACRYDLLSENLLERILALGRQDGIELVLTGRAPSERLLQCSDYISQIACVRHPYEKGIKARAGIEW